LFFSTRSGAGRHGKKVGRIAPLREQKSRDDWKIRAVVNHVTFVGDGTALAENRMIAWYVADPQQWSFRSVAEGESLIYSAAVQLSELVDTTVYLRVTTRPYPVSHWAKACYDNAADPQPGFDAIMDRDQMHAANAAQVDKLVFYGVDLGARARTVALLGKVSSSVVDREMAALQTVLDRVDELMSAGGLDASPATPADMEWLLARSMALGCPVPVPHPDEQALARLDSDDLAAFAAGSMWSADPLAPTVRITTSVNGAQVVRHVCVLTVSRIADIRIPEEHQPWMSKVDQLPFPVEWSARIDIRSADDISKEMTKLSNRVDSQMSHWRDDHGKRPPKQLGRQAQRTADVEDEMRTGFTGLSTRTRGWYRIAVSGQTEEEALERAAAVVAHYRPQVRLTREIGQYALAREFVPGEALATNAHSRKFPVLKVAAGLPAISAEVGDKRGFQIGETTGLTRRMVCMDPWYLTEVMEAGGLVIVVGTLGSGKSVLLQILGYKAILSGVHGAAMDPSGRMQQMMRLPELTGITRSVSLLGGRPGSLSPYGAVPDPPPELVRLDCDDPDDENEFADRMRMAVAAARSMRRDLALETMRWCLPYSMGRDPDVQRYLRTAIGTIQDRRVTSASEIVYYLDSRTDDERDIARELKLAQDRELGRLFFHEGGQDRTPLEFDRSQARFTVFDLKGLTQPAADVPLEEYTADEMLARPIMRLASWTALNLIYRADPHERKLFLLDEAHEITEGSGAGRALVNKIATDSRKNNLATFVSTQNASAVLGEKSINNFAGAVFVGRTGDEQAQRDALKLLGKPEGVGYEQILGDLSKRRRSGDELGYREFIYRDGLGGEGGRGGMEKIRVTAQHHPELFAAINTTADPTKRARLRQITPTPSGEHVA
jgi:hypothetical protein